MLAEYCFMTHSKIETVVFVSGLCVFYTLARFYLSLARFKLGRV